MHSHWNLRQTTTIKNSLSLLLHPLCLLPSPPPSDPSFSLSLGLMASMAAGSISLNARPRQMATAVKGFSQGSRSNLSFTLRPLPTRLSVSCAAKPETVDKVCEVVKKQLSLKASDEVTAATKFSALGADSLDTVEIVMGLEEAFDIEMEEDKAQAIETVEQAAELIEEILKAKA
ncbi:unnamed protein product [Eruca vesicaria subsp. sativa]|uniref:Acyl carrier protein n=1 Tax=Eruca vesicaria subsp. sativa TaxID=29727 RepID=A0ABC8KPE8_ERUVS|nr:unnamed protein product [Eruca vesicaria subsp. sativa]